MDVLLIHPDHGAKYAMSEAEIEYDLKHGWLRYTEPTPEVAEVDKPKRKYTRKPIEQPNDEVSASDESEGE